MEVRSRSSTNRSKLSLERFFCVDVNPFRALENLPILITSSTSLKIVKGVKIAAFGVTVRNVK